MEEKRNKKNVISLVVLCVSIIALTTSLTYAYFVSQIGTNDPEQVTITSGTLSLTFRDSDATVENIEGTWNFGDTIEKELVIENTGTKDTYAKISWDNLINTYLAESLTYTLEEKTDETGSTYKSVETEGTNVPRSETASTVLLADHLEIPAGHTYTYRLRITLEDLLDVDQTADINANFVTKFTIAESTKKWTAEDSLAKLNIKINPINKTTGFEAAATTDETAEGLFSMADDYGTSYYYRGTASNNYIKFGTNESGEDMWWRIIRFNGDGSIRMQHDGAGTAGTNTYTRGFALLNQAWNAKSDDAKYVGWMFGGMQGEASTSKEEAYRNETNSEIKTAVDEWYKTNILNKYHKYIADSIFCNDRNIPGKNTSGYSNDTGLGYGNNATGYGPYERFLKDTSNPKPQFTCSQQNDKFTVKESSGGNGASTYPVGLITADEIVAAGSGKFNTINTNYYLSKGSWYWSLSPDYFNSNEAHLFAVGTRGILGGSYTKGSFNGNGNVAPVINLKPEYLDKLQGTGQATDPFYILNA